MVDRTLGQNVLLTRYQVLAANRRHFSALYFGTVAFAWIFAIVLWATLTLTGRGPPGMTEAMTGLVILAGAFVEHRLLLRERSAFKAMCDCWRAISNEEEALYSKRTLPGAMSIVVIAQCVISVAVFVVAILSV